MTKALKRLKTAKGDVAIRPAVMADAERLRVYETRLTAEEASEPTIRETLKKERECIRWYIKGDRKRKARLLVAEHDKDVIGRVNIDRFPYNINNHVFVMGVSAAKDWRRLGLGKALSECAIAEGKRMGNMKVVTLNVAGFNKAAIKMYRKPGFRKVGAIPGGFRNKFNGRYYDEVIMAKRIR